MNPAVSKSLKRMHNLSLEYDDQSGQAVVEEEHEFYVLLDDLGFLRNAVSMDLQEQWQIRVPKTDKNDAKGSLRIRKVQQGSVNAGPQQESSMPIQYVLTTKADMAQGSRIETPTATSEDAFDLFAHLSDNGMVKHRYHFPVGDQGLVFEVDMFIDKETGKYCEWAKIDLEVRYKDLEIPSFPFEVKKCIKGDTTDEAEKKQISKLYDKYFIIPNKFLDKPSDLKKDMVPDDVDERDPGDHEFR